MPLKNTISQQPQFNKSVTYSITSNDMVERNSKNIIYRFPYSKNTFWTNFRLTRFGQNGMQQKTPSIDILIITADGKEYVVDSYSDTVPKWNTITNPIPSMKYNNIDGLQIGVYFRIYLSENDTIDAMPFHLMGYIDLFPSTDYYLYTYNQHIQYLFLRSNPDYGIILTILHDYHYDKEICKEYSDRIRLST